MLGVLRMLATAETVMKHIVSQVIVLADGIALAFAGGAAGFAAASVLAIGPLLFDPSRRAPAPLPCRWSAACQDGGRRLNAIPFAALVTCVVSVRPVAGDARLEAQCDRSRHQEQEQVHAEHDQRAAPLAEAGQARRSDTSSAAPGRTA
jgi:hypothetical protein